jgi:hypothetical protein
MIRVPRAREPEAFHEAVRRPGQSWLAIAGNREAGRPRRYWRECANDLRAQFSGRCGYLAMWIPGGETDHFVSWKRCQREGRHDLVYEWLNLRWAFPQVNQAKGAWLEPLDPFEVEDGWFELQLPSLQLVATDRLPLELREKAEVTLHELGLRDGHHAMMQRQAWLDRFRQGTPLHVIEQDAPLIGRALRRLLETPEGALQGPQRRFRRDLERARTAAPG